LEKAKQPFPNKTKSNDSVDISNKTDKKDLPKNKKNNKKANKSVAEQKESANNTNNTVVSLKVYNTHTRTNI
jgi:hypothetical protein